MATDKSDRLSQKFKFFDLLIHFLNEVLTQILTSSSDLHHLYQALRQCFIVIWDMSIRHFCVCITFWVPSVALSSHLDMKSSTFINHYCTKSAKCFVLSRKSIDPASALIIGALLFNMRKIWYFRFIVLYYLIT